MDDLVLDWIIPVGATCLAGIVAMYAVWSMAFAFGLLAIVVAIITSSYRIAIAIRPSAEQALTKRESER